MNRSIQKAKPGFVINPHSGREIKIGGKIFKQLLHQGEIDPGVYKERKHANLLYEVVPDQFETKEQEIMHLEKKKKELNKDLPLDFKTRAVRKGSKLYKQKRKITAESATRKTSAAAVSVFEQMKAGEIELPKKMTRKQTREYLEHLIYQRLVAKKEQLKEEPKPKVKKPKEKQKYIQVPSPALDSDSDADLIDGAFDDTEDER